MATVYYKFTLSRKKIEKVDDAIVKSKKITKLDSVDPTPRPAPKYALLPIFYGHNRLQAYIVWRSETKYHYTNDQYGIQQVLFVFGGDNHYAAAFPANPNDPAYIKEFADLYSSCGSSFSRLNYDFTKALIHWFLGWSWYQSTTYGGAGAMAVQALYGYDDTTPKFPYATACCAGNAMEIRYSLALQCSEYNGKHAFYEIRMSRAEFDAMAIWEKFLIGYYARDQVVAKSGIALLPLHELYELPDKAAAIDLIDSTCYSNIGNGDEYLPDTGLYASRLPGIMSASCAVCWDRVNDSEPEEIIIDVNKAHTHYASILLDLLWRAGIDITAYTRNMLSLSGDGDTRFYLNIAFTDQITIADAIKKICDMVGVQLYFTDRFRLKNTVVEDYTIKAVFTSADIDWKLEETDIEETPRYIKAYYRDFGDPEFINLYGERANSVMIHRRQEATISNDQLVEDAGYSVKDVDLSGLETEDDAVARVTLIGKQETKKVHYGSITGSLAFYEYNPGDVIELDFPDVLEGKLTMQMKSKTINESSISFEILQIAPISLYNQGSTGNPEEITNTTIKPITFMPIIELPTSIRYEHDLAMMVMPMLSMETRLSFRLARNYKIMLYKSATAGGVFSYWQDIGGSLSEYDNKFCTRGKLAEDILINARERTENTDTIYLKVKDLEFEFEDGGKYLILINDEWFSADGLNIVGSEYRFKGYCRAQFGTDIAPHSVDDDVYIFRRFTIFGDDGYLFGFDAATAQLERDYQFILDHPDECYLKPILYNPESNSASPLSSTPAFHYDPQELGKKPLPIRTIKATRSGSSVDILWHPRSMLRAYDGAGVDQAQNQVPHDPPLIEGTFLYSINGAAYIEQAGHTLNISDASSFTIAVKNKVNGIESDPFEVTIGATDGIYYNGTIWS